MDDFSRSVLVGKNYLHANSIQDSIAALNLSIDLLASGRTGGGQSTGKRGKEKKGKGRRRSRSAGSRRGHETVPLPPPLVDAASSSAHAHTAADAARQANPRFPDVVDEQLAAASVLQLRGAAFLAAGAIDAALADATAALDLLESHEATEPPIPIVRPSPLGSRLAPSIERRLSVSPARSVSLSNAIAPLSSSARSNGNTSDSDSRGRDSAPYVSLRALSPSSLFDDDCPPATMLVDEETEDQLQVPPPDVRPPPDEMVARILRCRVHLVQAGAELCAGRPRAAATFALQACMADGQWGVLALEGLALRGAALLRAGEPAKAATSFATAAGLCEGSVYSRCRFDPMWPTSEDFAQRRTSLLAYAMNAYRLAGGGGGGGKEKK
uniref:Uncharacterized protein n=1 Tax=Sexangularia sp. CB-2014 TaxID=1486929 RepID=A0A7S1YKB4_9EUKA|mmetsp:Transcript_702/g.2178  ORF Transcript_702/g.2178 Transcript_702/m.2178 type:complete len:383 (+) Transcript_702:116-1264(+)